MDTGYTDWVGPWWRGGICPTELSPHDVMQEEREPPGRKTCNITINKYVYRLTLLSM